MAERTLLPRRIPASLAAGLAAIMGTVIPIQARVNGELSTELGDPLATGVISFGGGVVILAVLLIVLPRLRQSLPRLRSGLSQQRVPWFYLCAGVSGAFFVVAQSLTVAVIGVALFTVAVVAGQSLSGLLIDTYGLVQNPRHHPSVRRLVGTVAVMAAVFIAVSGSLQTADSVLVTVGPTVLVVVAGGAAGFQHAMNARVGAVMGTPLGAAITNFISGTSVLLIAFIVRGALVGFPTTMPTAWWLYTGGVWGIVFIAGSAALIPHSGVLLVSLASVCGQLIGSLLLDVFFPVGDTVITVAQLLGTALAFVAVLGASVPGPRRHPRSGVRGGEPGAGEAATALLEDP